MFFSLYASFRWAGTENYALKIVAFTIVASLISAQVATTFFAMLSWDTLAILSLMLGGLNPSFPFYAHVFGESRLALPPPNDFSQWIRTYEIRVPAMAVFQLVPRGPVERSNGESWVNVLNYRAVLLNMEIGSIPPDGPSAIGTLFLFFLLVNVMGALLGFSMSKLQLDKLPILNRIELDSIGLIGRVLFGAVFLTAGLWFTTIGQVIITGPVSRYYYSYNPYLYVGDAYACVIFGIIWLAIVVAEEKIL